MSNELNLINVTSGYNLSGINLNFTAIQTGLNKALNREGGPNNSMEADLDMNGYDLLNIERVKANQLSVGGKLVVTDALALVSIGVKGNWLTATSYIINDIVSYNGSSYMSKTVHTSSSTSEPGVGVSWETDWLLIASKGDKGDKGDQGASGSGSGDLVASQNLSDVDNTATALTNLGGVTQADFNVLNGAALLDSDVGTTANKIVQLDGSARLPAVDGSQLTGISSGSKLKAVVTTETSATSSYVELAGFASFAVKKISNSVFISANMLYSWDTFGSGGQPVVALFVDGVEEDSIIPFRSDGNEGTITMIAPFIYSPGDTSNHTYSFRVKKTGGGAVTYRVGEVTLQELES